MRLIVLKMALMEIKKKKKKLWTNSKTFSRYTEKNLCIKDWAGISGVQWGQFFKEKGIKELVVVV